MNAKNLCSGLKGVVAPGAPRCMRPSIYGRMAWGVKGVGKRSGRRAQGPAWWVPPA